MTPNEQEMSFIAEAQMIDNQEWEMSILKVINDMVLSDRISLKRNAAIHHLNFAVGLLKLDEQECRKLFVAVQAHVTDFSLQQR